MNRLIFAPLSALALCLPVSSQAQQLPAAVIAILDRDRVGNGCTQCVAAAEQLRAQGRAYQARETQLSTPLLSETQAIQAAINSLPEGTQPGAALRTRAQALQTNTQAAEGELSQARSTFARNQQHVIRQVSVRMEPLIRQVMVERGANVVIDARSTLAIDPSIDVTDAVLVLMNHNSTPFSTVAPPPPTSETNPPRS